MLANLLKSLSVTNKSQLRYTYDLTRRQLCFQKANKVDKDEEDVITNLFDQSSVKFKPVSAEEILRKNKTQKSTRKDYKTGVSSKAKLVNVPTPIKKTHLERSSESVVINDKELGLEFVKLSLNDPLLTTLLTMARSKKRRDKDGQIILEGRRLILEALTCDLKLNAIIFSQKDQLAEMKEQVADYIKRCPSKIYKVPHHDLKTWSTLTTPPGVMAVFERPSLNHVVRRLSERSSTPPLPVTVVCDNIREPNNLGSIIRTCAALPCYQIVITKGCCDPWDSKALRGGCGGQFRVPLRDDVDWQDVAMTIPPEVANDCCVFIAENNLQNKTKIIDYADMENVGSHNVVIIGGESHGVSTEAYRFMDTVGSRGKCLYIPLAEGIDSLNVASALTLILYEMRKNILKKEMMAPPVSENTQFNANDV